MLYTGRGRRCTKARNSSASHGSPPKNGLKELLNMADEFEAKLCHKYREYSARFVVIEERARPILS